VIKSHTVYLVIVAGCLGMLLASCAKDKATVAEPADGPSTRDIRASDVADAVPRNEPRARYGNHSPYEVFGKKYHVLPSSEGYRANGVASWYGSKFHGRRTSSGEPYDMHLATAAHKSLPLPTYAEVTNLDNGKKVIVKINDRGPFKHDRLIDMSYGAALRLGMTGSGTARVEVRVIEVSDKEPAVSTTPYVNPATPATGGTWLQAGAYGKREGAERLTGELERAGLRPASIHEVGGLYRVWLGPYDSQSKVESVVNRAIELGFERPHRVKR
jgi:rare lipoprotein A